MQAVTTAATRVSPRGCARAGPDAATKSRAPLARICRIMEASPASWSLAFPWGRRAMALIDLEGVAPNLRRARFLALSQT